MNASTEHDEAERLEHVKEAEQALKVATRESSKLYSGMAERAGDTATRTYYAELAAKNAEVLENIKKARKNERARQRRQERQ